MPLSKLEKQQAEDFAQRLHYLIEAVEEAADRASVFSEEKRTALLTEFLKSPAVIGGVDENGNIVRGGLPKIDACEPYVQHMEEQVRYYLGRTVPEEFPVLVGSANAGVLALQQHVAFNYPRIDGTVSRRLTQLHIEAKAERRRKKADAKKILNDNEEAKPVYSTRDDDDNVHEHKEDRQLFQPSPASRNSRRPITIDVFETLSSNKLFNSIFFVDDPDYAECVEDLVAFEILCRKDCKEGKSYEVRWEGTYDATDMTPEELKSAASNGLWMSTA